MNLSWVEAITSNTKGCIREDFPLSSDTCIATWAKALGIGLFGVFITHLEGLLEKILAILK